MLRTAVLSMITGALIGLAVQSSVAEAPRFKPTVSARSKDLQIGAGWISLVIRIKKQTLQIILSLPLLNGSKNLAHLSVWCLVLMRLHA